MVQVSADFHSYRTDINMSQFAEYQRTSRPAKEQLGAQLESSSIRKQTEQETAQQGAGFRYLNRRPSRLRSQGHQLNYLDNSFQHVVTTIPFYNNDQTNCLDLNFSIPAHNCCAWEIWVPSENHAELVLGESVYIGLDHFEAISKQTRFLYGIGLPGQVWKTRRPVIMSNLPGCEDFMRADMANRFGLNLGIGIPICGPEGELAAVLVCLLDTFEEFTRRLEVWTVRDNGTLDCLERMGTPNRVTLESDLEMIQESVEQKAPLIQSQLSVPNSPQSSKLQGSFTITIPTFVDNKVDSVIFLSK